VTLSYDDWKTETPSEYSEGGRCCDTCEEEISRRERELGWPKPVQDIEVIAGYEILYLCRSCYNK